MNDTVLNNSKASDNTCFDPDDLWGIVTFSGTDGNNHGLYLAVSGHKFFGMDEPAGFFITTNLGKVY